MYFKVIGGVEENCLLGTLPTQAVFNFLANFKKLIEGEKKMSTEKEVILTPEGLD